MRKYQFVHTIKSSETKRLLEDHLSGLSDILSYEAEARCFSYEIQTGIRKKEFTRSLRTFIQGLSLSNEEMVVLYDPGVHSDPFELPGKNEKIFLHGDIEKNNRVEESILVVFKRIQLLMELDKVKKEYFNSLSHIPKKKH